MPPCTFADGSNEPAPEWVCGAPVDDIALSGVGYSDKSVAGPNFMKQMAATAARLELAQIMQAEVQSMIKQYAESTGAADTETVDQVNSVVTKQITRQSLVGSKIYRQMPSPSGGMVVLVGVTQDTVEQLTQQAITTSMNNEKALWQKFQAEKSFEELAQDIAKYRPGTE